LEKVRTFIAINLDSKIKEYLSSLKNNLKTDNSKIKWVEENNLHITLKFLGYILPQHLELIDLELKKITNQYPSFSIKLSSDIGIFPSYKMPRIIWVGIKESSHKLTELYNSIEERLYKNGFPKENKRFSSHITIGRIKYIKDKNSLINNLKQISIERLSQKVESVELMKSELTSKGPVYRVFHKYLLLK